MSTITAPLSPARLNIRFIFDLTFGVFVPLICLIADPIVFRAGTISFASGMLTAFKIAAYTSIAISVTALAAWLIFRRPLAAYSGYLDGIFMMAQVMAFLLALYILPDSLTAIGITGFGLLGLTPFVTSFVFFHQHRLARADASMLPHRARNTLIGALVAIIIPLLLQTTTTSYVNNALLTILNDPDSSAAAVTQLKTAFWCGDECFYELVLKHYQFRDDPDRQQYFATIYRDITGDEIPQIQDRFITRLD